MKAIQILLAAIVALAVSAPLAGIASAAESERLRVGLVLGGGGARGAAHIGVLKELERLQIPIDAIAGTSMGAIVGGLYAAGTSADELEHILMTLDWSRALSDSPRRRNLSFRRKQDDVRYPVGLELGVRDGEMILPLGVVQGHNLDLVLRKLTANAAHISDFDALPIPFRSVAANIETGEAYVMASGDLARSIRASMSVPGLIAPTLLDGNLLVDGGVVANLPISVMRTMDVDVIIAVEVDFPLYSPQELNSAPAITEQMLTILMRRDTQRQIATLGPDDVLIQPELDTFASSNFNDAGFAITRGVEAVGDVEARLLELAVDDETFATYMAGRTPTPREGDTLEFVRIKHDGRLATELLMARVGVYAGDTLDPDHLASGANRLYGLDMFEQINYEVVEDEGKVGVEYTAVPKSWGPDFLNVGIGLQDDFDGSTAFNLAARLTKTGLNSRGAEWRTDVQLGTDLSLQSEFYQPFGSGLKYFIAPRFDWHQNNQNVFIDDQNLAQLRVAEGELGLDVGAELGSFGEFRLGAYSGDGKWRVKIGDPQFPDYNYDTGGIFALLQVDTFDQSRFPRSGFASRLKWDMSSESLGADQNFDKLEFEILSAWSRGKSTLHAGISYATTFDVNDQLQEFTPLGGFLRLSGLNYGQISGPHAAIGRLIYYRQLGDYSGGLLEIPVYIGASAEFGNVWLNRSDIDFDSLLANGSVFAALDTYFGAIYFAVGFSEGGERAYYLSIGSQPR
jgi:NTE family protein